jgi:predicted nucleic acid-binding protein
VPAARLRCVIDSMVFDAIAAEPGLTVAVDRLTSAGRVELLAALDTMREIAATPDPGHRRALRRVRVLVVPPPDPADPATGPLFARLRGSTGVGDGDARIAMAAAAQGVPLVTEDRDLRLAAEAQLPGLVLWRWRDDLRPRILARLSP